MAGTSKPRIVLGDVSLVKAGPESGPLWPHIKAFHVDGRKVRSQAIGNNDANLVLAFPAHLVVFVSLAWPTAALKSERIMVVDQSQARRAYIVRDQNRLLIRKRH